MHILGGFGPGGAEMGVVRLIQAMKAPDISHSVCSLSPDLRMKTLLPPDIPCYSLNITGPGRFAFWTLSRLFQKARVDIAHVNNIAPWFDTALASRLSGSKCIQTFHGVEDVSIRFSFPKKLIIHAASKLSDHIGAVSEASKELFSALTGINLSKIHIIRNGIDTEMFAPVDTGSKTSIRQQLGIPEDGVVIGCAAALRPVKNHRGLISAFSEAIRDQKRAVLVLVGDGPLHEELKNQCRKLKLDGKVIFTGRKENVDQYLKAFDFFVLNSKTEGLSYAILEAMASGLPVIATDVGGNSRIVQNNEDGFLYPEGDEERLARILAATIENPEATLQMGKAARRKILTFYSIHTMVSQYQTLYEKLS